MSAAEAPCPCGSGATLARCCAPLLAGAPAPHPEALMRSRYTAFVRGDDAYLLRSWHSSTRPEQVDSAAGPQWQGLEILGREGGGEQDDEGLVEFIAHYRAQGRAGRLHEISRFRREDGCWRYLDGRIQPEPGRNAPCPCGSGRKFKRCCGR